MPSRSKKKTKSSLKNFMTSKRTATIVDLLVVTILVVIIVLIVKYNNTFGSKDGFYSRKNKKGKKSNKSKCDNTLRIVVDNNHNHNHQDQPNFKTSKHYERIINPLLPPERSFEHTVGIPINVPTRGEGGPFQQVGALYKESVTEFIDSEDENSNRSIPGNNSDSVVLPLFGRPTYPKSNKWTYHITSDKNNQVKMPLTNKGKKCDNQYGCEEIQNDDLISVPGYNGQFRAVIYDYDAPKYIPCL